MSCTFWVFNYYYTQLMERLAHCLIWCIQLSSGAYKLFFRIDFLKPSFLPFVLQRLSALLREGFESRSSCIYLKNTTCYLPQILSFSHKVEVVSISQELAEDLQWSVYSDAFNCPFLHKWTKVRVFEIFSRYSICMTSQKCHVEKEILKKYFCPVINSYFLRVSVLRA